MRVNQPVTGREYHLSPGATLLSTTDPRGTIRFANAAFVEASGFTLEELRGQPHNLVRHPDMPPEAFADMWRTLKAGYSWSALVKNRRKNGDHYWVRANVTPVVRGRTLAGYMSVRTTPSRAEVEAAERLYADMRAGRANHLMLHRGVLVHRHRWLRRTAQSLPVAWRIRLTFALTFVAWCALARLTGPSLLPLAAGTLALLGLAATVLDRQLALPLADLLRQALAVAAGNTEAEPELGRVDELGLLRRALNQAGLNIRSLVDDVTVQVRGLGDATNEIASASEGLRGRSEQVGASLETTTGSIEDLATTVRSSSTKVASAATAATAASDIAGRSGKIVGDAVGMMQQVTAASDKIADITEVIDGMAVQTNILALNAAVEAARAGEHGRGFAVVAGEIRALAQRSADAAREIRDLIAASVAKVDSGARLVRAAGSAMDETVVEVSRLTHVIRDIQAATAEQSAGLEQVLGSLKRTVGDIENMTGANAMLAEQFSSSASGVGGRTARLADAIEVFEEDAVPAARTAERPAPAARLRRAA